MLKCFISKFFGVFGSSEEYSKYLRASIIFAFLIGIYWTLRPLKDSIFIQFVDVHMIPFAKTFSLIFMGVGVLIYNFILKRCKGKSQIFRWILAFYTVVITVLAGITHIFTGTHSQILAYAIGYFSYFLIESFGSFCIAFFWNIMTDICEGYSAKIGFHLIYFFGQIGGAIIPFFVPRITTMLKCETNTLTFAIVGGLIIFTIYRINAFYAKTPLSLLCPVNKENISQKKSSFKLKDAFKLIFSNKYISSLFFYELIMSAVIVVIDFNFKILSAENFSGPQLTQFLGTMGAATNLTAGILLLGISAKIQKHLGLTVSIAMTPILVTLAFSACVFIPSLSLYALFGLIVVAKSSNYAFRGAFKQSYIPTSENVHFTLQATNDIFTSRSSKELGSITNMLSAVVSYSKYLAISAAIYLPLCAVWIGSAVFVGKRAEKAIKNKEIII
jgi:AAA family ATP:ADP antiporter